MVILVMGVSGSGKSTVGRALAQRTGGRFVDGDDHHPAANVAKMASGLPLTEGDRAPWLQALRAVIDAWLLEGGVYVLACSALTERSREVLGADRDGVHIVHLRGSQALIRERMRAREHFMPPELLESQFAALEPPQSALELDIEEAPEALVERIVRALGLG